MSAALLLMDLQRSIVDRYGESGEAVARRAGEAAGAARAAGVPVILVRVAFRPGHPEVSPSNRTFSALRDAGGMLETDELIHPAVGAQPEDVIVTKRRVSAFAGSDLDVVLRAAGVRHLVLGGIATSGVVLSTTRAAADLDFDLTILRDACADADEEVHRVLLDKVLARQAEVVDVADWVATLG